jgi:hypothetical protein
LEIGIFNPQFRRVELHHNRLSAGHGDVRNIGIVGRLEDDRPVAGVQERQRHAEERLSRAAGDGHLGLPIDLAAVLAQPLRRHRLAQPRCAGHGRVLV